MESNNNGKKNIETSNKHTHIYIDAHYEIYNDLQSCQLEAACSETRVMLRRSEDNGDGELTVDEFVDGIMRCRGQARQVKGL